MTGRNWLVAAFAGLALAQAGCVTCCHKGYEKALASGPECDLPAPARNQVYVFLIDGLTPPSHNGLGALRARLGENGFAKVGIADLPGALGIEHEIKAIRACEPDARFVLVGYDLGGAAAVADAKHLAGKGIPLDAVVLLDPVGCKEACVAPTLLITSGKKPCAVPHSSRVVVPDAGHFGLPGHPTTVAAITDLLATIAANNYEPAAEGFTEWTYPHAPEVRPEPVGRWSAEWDFLADRGAPRSIGAGVATRPQTPAPAPAAAPPGAAAIRK
jgi:hypothetical protein